MTDDKERKYIIEQKRGREPPRPLKNKKPIPEWTPLIGYLVLEMGNQTFILAHILGYIH